MRQQPPTQSAPLDYSCSSSSRDPAPGAALRQHPPGCRPPPATSCLSNLGGALFTTNCAMLEESQPQSMLAALVSGRHGLPRHDAKVRGAGEV